MKNRENMRIDKLISNPYKHLVSFAYWEFEGYVDKNGVLYDLAVNTLQKMSTQQEVDNIGLNTQTICLGLNYGTFKEGVTELPEYANFHEMAGDNASQSEFILPTTLEKSNKTLHNDERLGYALYNTKAWGSLMLDLICKDKNGEFNGYPEGAIKVALDELKTKEQKRNQIDGVIEILDYFETSNPQIICFGKDVYAILNENLDYIREKLGSETNLINSTHYSRTTGKSHDDYINRILRNELSSI